MEKNIMHIQELINARADKKLEADLRALKGIFDTSVNSFLVKDIFIEVGTADKPRKVDLDCMFDNSVFGIKIIENNTQRYREAESKLFLAEVNSLREDVDNLLNP